MKKIILIITSIILISGVMVACSTGGNGMKLLTQQELIKACDLSYEDTNMVDLEDFIISYQLTKNNISSIDIYSLLEEYRNQHSNNMEYLLNNLAKEDKLPNLNVDSIRYIAFFYHIGPRTVTVLFNFHENIIYYIGDDNLFKDVTKANFSVFSSNDKEAIVSLLNNNILNWKYNYKGSSSGTTGSLAWSLTIEFDNHELYRYTGKGVMRGTPDNFSNLREEFWKYLNE